MLSLIYNQFAINKYIINTGRILFWLYVVPMIFHCFRIKKYEICIITLKKGFKIVRALVPKVLIPVPKVSLCYQYWVITYPIPSRKNAKGFHFGVEKVRGDSFNYIVLIT